MELESTNLFRTTPMGALVTLSQEEGERFIDKLTNMPPNLAKLTTSLRVGAFLKGLTRTYNLPEASTSLFGILVLRVILGEVQLNQLSGFISIKLALDPPTATKIASEIEKELFAPVSLELNSYLRQKNPAAPAAPKPPSAADGLPNVLNLKKPFDPTQGKPSV